jgi:hypothetical protein
LIREPEAFIFYSANAGNVPHPMRNRVSRFVAIAAILTAAALLSACGGGSSSTRTAASSVGGQSTAASKPKPKPPGKNVSAAQFDPKSFGAPATGANPWLPLKPGTQWTREGTVDVGTRKLTHRVISTVTDVSRPVDGVRTVIVLDQDINGGQIAEQSLDYEAEDNQGNVWYLGSYTEAYQGGQFVNASDAWLAGVKGSKPGILMPTNPSPGYSYSEDTVPGIEAPSAKVAKTGQSQCVPFRCFKNVLVVDEEGSEYKYYAPGVGQILTEPIGSGGKHEIEKLVNATQLSPGGLARISDEVVKLDKHASVTAPDVFGNAPAAKRSL